ncbi:MAG: endonuclease/exonuclease/phosphatase family protein [Cytophagales bacterium]|nr:endonuclease/exonuclease/phosphatase family protein [Cytophagales bacterium]
MLLVISLFCYASSLVSPETLWIAGFLALAIPVCMVGHLVLLITWLVIGKLRMAIYPAVGLLAAFPYWRATFALNLPSNTTPDFEVLSYNVRLFNAYDRAEHSAQAKAIVQWVIHDSSDIKCLQEYYQLDSSQLFNISQRMDRRAGYYHYFSPCCNNDLGGEMGLAIYSRFPIVNQGFIDLKGRYRYGAIFADVVVRKDTVRIYNIHLQSMSINEHAIFQNSSDTEKIKHVLKDLFQRLRYGFIRRGMQIQIILQHIASSPYRVILCGDLNDVPYSYTYYQFSRFLENTFESAASGFGFTYNGKLFFLRIDNQFYSKGLQPTYLRTIRQVDYSDHFPLKAGYSILPR